MAMSTTTYIPATPTNLTATAVSSTRINLAWTDKSDNESGFKIERVTDGQSNWTQIATVAANIRTYSDNSLLPGRGYAYRVRACNATNEYSSYSNAAWAITLP